MLTFHFWIHFIRHYLGATRIDVLHSPFVFDLYNTCIKAQPHKGRFRNITKLVKSLRRDKQVILQTDYGRGGVDEPVKRNSISWFIRRHSKPARVVSILYYLVKRYEYSHIIELGTSLGIGASYMAAALKDNDPTDRKFVTVEGAEELAAVAMENFSHLRIDDYVTVTTGSFDDILPEVLSDFKKIDMAVIDGNHRYEPTIDYFAQLLPLVHEQSLLVFDDIYQSPEMTRAWQEIKQHPQVTITVDLLFTGLVFFRKGQAKEHFKLRVL